MRLADLQTYHMICTGALRLSRSLCTRSSQCVFEGIFGIHHTTCKKRTQSQSRYIHRKWPIKASLTLISWKKAAHRTPRMYYKGDNRVMESESESILASSTTTSRWPMIIFRLIALDEFLHQVSCPAMCSDLAIALFDGSLLSSGFQRFLLGRLEAGKPSQVSCIDDGNPMTRMLLRGDHETTILVV